MEFALVALRGPSNIEKKVRELQGTLYRESGLASAQALPAIIPLCFLARNGIPATSAELREDLRRAVGREAPYLTSGAVAECDGFLYWELAPRKELQRLRRNCEKVFASPGTRAVDREAARQPEVFPVGRGFFLCSLQGRSRNKVPFLEVLETLRFPVKAAFVLHVHTLGLESGTGQKDASARDDRPLWKSLFWEKLEEIPLRKTRTTGQAPAV
jgi:hypothetical protein